MAQHMTFGRSQSAVGALWDGFVDLAGDVLGTSGYRHEKKVWKAIMGEAAFCRNAYNANKDSLKYRDEVVGHQNNSGGHYSDITLYDHRRNMPDHLKQHYQGIMGSVVNNGNFSSHQTFLSTVWF